MAKVKFLKIKPQNGFSMIEILVSVLILGIGLLGVAGVQLLSVQQTSNANVRSQATIVAQDVAERIRANGGANISSDDLSELEDNFKKNVGPDGDIEITINGNFAEIDLGWSERDPFSSSRSSEQTLTIRARL